MTAHSMLAFQPSRHMQSEARSAWKAFTDGSCTIALYCLHLLYVVYIALGALHAYVTNLWGEEEATRERIAADKANLTKIPVHLTVVVSQELALERTEADWERIIRDLCLASCWAWEFGIQEMSVFDASGILKSLAIDVYKQQSAALHHWMQVSALKKDRSLAFSLLSADDGRQQVARVAQTVAHHVTRTAKGSDSIDVELVDTFMHDASMTDPDLMIVYDGLPHNYVSLDGYPPWHIRLTEFVNATDQHRLSYSVFSSCLYKFSKVKQRFGR